MIGPTCCSVLGHGLNIHIFSIRKLVREQLTIIYIPRAPLVGSTKGRGKMSPAQAQVTGVTLLPTCVVARVPASSRVLC
uniref:Uncharacterized protein n=1 Tax=Setaria italica TaxID=4555 RepID=K3ZKQ5_SETIT